MLILFYDSACGLCQRAVRLLIRADPDGRALRFAPLGGRTFDSLVPAGQREALPDSLVARSEDGRLHIRSGALVEALSRLGPGCRVVAMALRLVPRPLRDAGYDLVARWRSRWFARSEDCSVTPAGADAFLP